MREELARREEPTLEMTNIQGNVVAGFKKPFQTLLFFRIGDEDVEWLSSSWLSPRSPVGWRPPIRCSSTTGSVDKARASNSTPPKATWMNLAFSSAGLRKLRNDVDQFADAAFRRRDGAAIAPARRSAGVAGPRGIRMAGKSGTIPRTSWSSLQRMPRRIVTRMVEFVRAQFRKHGGATEVRCDEGFVHPGAPRHARAPSNTSDTVTASRSRDSAAAPRMTRPTCSRPAPIRPTRTMASGGRISSGPASSSSATAIRTVASSARRSIG